jgi:endonuclease/exonuclease/phosphatase family metal-dependent hydrolase
LVTPPDVVVLQEVTLADADMPGFYRRELERRTGKVWNAVFTQMVTGAAQAQSQGNLILTWLPFDQALSKVVCAVPGDHNAPAQSSCAAFVGYALTVNSVQVQFVGVHLNVSNLEYRTYQLRELAAWLNTLGPSRIVSGDFNMEPLDPLWAEWKSTYADVWAGVVGVTGDLGYTKDKRTFTNMPGRIDYQFIPAGSTRIGVQMSMVKTILSDHHVVFADDIIQ